MNVKDFGIKHLNTIPGVLLPNDISIMKIEEVTNNMAHLIDVAQSVSTQLLETFAQDNRDLLMAHLNDTQTMLSAVYARKLMIDLDRIMDHVKQGNRSKCEALLERFASELLSLSIATQKAMLSTSLDSNELAPSEAAANAAIISDLSAIKYLIDNAEYARAFEMIEVIRGIACFDKTSQIKSFLKSFNRDEALAVVQSMIDELALKTLGNKASLVTGKKKVLAVDDRPEILTVLSDVLKDEYHIFCVPSGEAAVRVLDKHDIRMFILDIEMPNMNGLELATIIKSRPQYAKVPIVFLTGNATKKYLYEAISVGASDFIVKPIVRENIIFKVRQYIPN